MAGKTNNTILIVDDNSDIRLALTLLLEQAGYKTLEADSAFQCAHLLERVTPDLVLLDMNFTRDTTSGQEGLVLLEQIAGLGVPIVLMTAWANIDLVVQGMRLGAVDFVEKPWNKSQLLNKIHDHISHAHSTADDELWVAESPVMQALEQQIRQYAATDANVLILGENGTGKSLLASRIHKLSNKAAAPFVALNMAAIPTTLFESELFGHKRGAFTDAKEDRLGVFSRANKGTLFMDEIGSLPMELQPKLLQVLETGEFRSLGANNNEKSTVRLIAATNQDLSQAIEQGQFRQDLYYRLNTFVVTLPPLRQRRQDIPELAIQLAKQLCDKYHKPSLTIDEMALAELINFDWPGNVRELSHVIERAVLVASDNVIRQQDILLDQNNTLEPSLSGLTLEQLERQRIHEALTLHQGKIGRAAQELGISRHALYRRMEKYQLESTDE